MSLTPVEVRHLTLRRGIFGYRRSDVRREIDEVADSFEAVWRERAELGERVHALETEVARHVEPRTT
jgi:cell division septum initiation protein DivIVA